MRKTCIEPMYLCEHCGHITAEVKKIHGLYEDLADTSCPICGEDMELTDNQCAACGEYITEETRLNNQGLCEACATKLTTVFDDFYNKLMPEQKERLLEHIERTYWQ